jgi:hypothetical protein
MNAECSIGSVAITTAAKNKSANRDNLREYFYIYS